MSEIQSEPESRIASVSRQIDAPAARIFELIADPTLQPSWDGMDNLDSAPAGQRIKGSGEVFTMLLKNGVTRENHVVEFDEGSLVAWQPAEPGNTPPGHLWRWELEPLAAGRTLVTHTYDWTALHDESRFERARATTPATLKGSIDKLAEHASTD